MVLRSHHWKKAVEKGIEILRRSKHPIAKTTIEIIDNRKVKLFPYNKVSNEDFQTVRVHLRDSNKDLPNDYPPTKFTLEKITKEFGIAWNQENRIYLSENLSPEKMASALVHEVNHFLNDSGSHYDNNDEIFNEELRAHVAEKMFKDIIITRQKMKETAKKVATRYKLPLPTKITIPDGEYYPIPKMLRK